MLILSTDCLSDCYILSFILISQEICPSDFSYNGSWLWFFLILSIKEVGDKPSRSFDWLLLSIPLPLNFGVPWSSSGTRTLSNWKVLFYVPESFSSFDSNVFALLASSVEYAPVFYCGSMLTSAVLFLDNVLKFFRLSLMASLNWLSGELILEWLD